MIETIIFIILLLVVLYPMIFSKLARSTNELAKLNRILEEGIEKQKRGCRDYYEEVRKLESIKWRFHQDKADIFINLYTLCSDSHKK